MNSSAAQAWFVAGTIPLMAAGALHAVGTLIDTVRPTFFTPTDQSVKPVTEGTGIELVRMFGGRGARPPMWPPWPRSPHPRHPPCAVVFGWSLRSCPPHI